jgi:hypothetical protein
MDLQVVLKWAISRPSEKIPAFETGCFAQGHVFICVRLATSWYATGIGIFEWQFQCRACGVPNNRATDEVETKWSWLSRYYPRIFLEGLSKSTKYLYQHRWSLDWDSNRAPTEYKSRLLLLGISVWYIFWLRHCSCWRCEHILNYATVMAT